MIDDRAYVRGCFCLFFDLVVRFFSFFIVESYFGLLYC